MMKGHFQIRLAENINEFKQTPGDQVPHRLANERARPAFLSGDKPLQITGGQVAAGIFQAGPYRLLDMG
jgi:hypothetical protein